MLEIRPNCEWCDKDLPPEADDAHICSYECTFCSDCVEDVLEHICPNCGGDFVKRPIRPTVQNRSGVSLENQPASTKRIHSPFSIEEVKQFSKNIQIGKSG